jgi:tRNA pseudouridine55 synthase
MAVMDGALIVDKPTGPTSHDVVARVRNIIGEKRVGHTGTLDPFATGVLVMLVGRATRLAQFLSGAEKEYEAIVRLGYATDTGDVTGARVQEQLTTEIRREEIEAALASLCGEIEQIPPMYSAKKIGGRKLYELARHGEDVSRKPARVTVSKFEAVNRGDELLKKNDDGTHDLSVCVVCSAGTYIRTLAEDFGRRLGVGAHLAELCRTRAGQFKIEDAITLERLDELAKSVALAEVLISPNAALSHLPVVELSPDDARRAVHGVDVGMEDSDWHNGQSVRMCRGRELIAVGIYDEEKRSLHPTVVLVGE